MVIIRIKGGLGNQLFQYAVGYSVAKRLNTKLALDTTFYPQQTLRGYKLEKLRIDYRDIMIPNKTIQLLKNKYLNKALRNLDVSKLKAGKNTTFLLETRSDIMPLTFTEDANILYLDGYYQSELYFRHFRDDIIRQFMPVYPIEQEYEETLHEIESVLSVAVHVRRGDFIKGANDSNPNHYLLGEQYYHNSLKYMKEQLSSDIVFYWFSDDIKWVKDCFGSSKNYKYVSLKTKNADIDEMMLMKNCKHIIAANSTFSWWASWLNSNPNAIRTVPSKRYGNLHMIPKNWIKISAE